MGEVLLTPDTLEDPHLPEKKLAVHVRCSGEVEPTDGLWIHGCGRLYVGATEQDVVKVRQGDRVTTVVRGKRLRWPEAPVAGTVQLTILPV